MASPKHRGVASIRPRDYESFGDQVAVAETATSSTQVTSGCDFQLRPVVTPITKAIGTPKLCQG